MYAEKRKGRVLEVGVHMVGEELGSTEEVVRGEVGVVQGTINTTGLGL